MAEYLSPKCLRAYRRSYGDNPSRKWERALNLCTSAQIQRKYTKLYTCIAIEETFEAWMAEERGEGGEVIFPWVLMSRNLVERFGGNFLSGCLVLSESTGNFTSTAVSTWRLTHRKEVFGNLSFHLGAWMLSWTLAGLSNLGLQIRTSVTLHGYTVNQWYQTFYNPTNAHVEFIKTNVGAAFLRGRRGGGGGYLSVGSDVP